MVDLSGFELSFCHCCSMWLLLYIKLVALHSPFSVHLLTSLQLHFYPSCWVFVLCSFFEYLLFFQIIAFNCDIKGFFFLKSYILSSRIFYVIPLICFLFLFFWKCIYNDKLLFLIVRFHSTIVGGDYTIWCFFSCFFFFFILLFFGSVIIFRLIHKIGIYSYRPDI